MRLGFHYVESSLISGTLAGAGANSRAGAGAGADARAARTVQTYLSVVLAGEPVVLVRAPARCAALPAAVPRVATHSCQCSRHTVVVAHRPTSPSYSPSYSCAPWCPVQRPSADARAAQTYLPSYSPTSLDIACIRSIVLHSFCHRLSISRVARPSTRWSRAHSLSESRFLCRHDSTPPRTAN